LVARQKSLSGGRAIEEIDPVYQDVPNAVPPAYPVSVLQQPEAEQQALDDRYFDSAVGNHPGSQSVEGMLVDVDSRLTSLVVRQEGSDSVSVAGDFYFA
jgi:hypothetical protein